MSAEFLKLYRELCKTKPNSKSNDVSYIREREQIMRTLGYDCGSDSIVIEPSKHHGRAARRFGGQKRLQALGHDNRIDAKKMRELQEIRKRTDKLKIISEKIFDHSLNKEDIPSTIWIKHDALFDSDTNFKTKYIPKLQPLSPSKKEQQIIITKTIPRHELLLKKDHTKHRWSKEERDKLNFIYHSLNRPPDKSITAWDQYYTEFTRRFQAFFPHRKYNEIKEKITEMMTLRQMKEPGEVKLWNTIKRIREGYEETTPTSTSISTSTLKSNLFQNSTSNTATSSNNINGSINEVMSSLTLSPSTKQSPQAKLTMQQSNNHNRNKGKIILKSR
eukprot:gene7966-16307_t